MYRKYLSDPTEDVRVATEVLLADFLREIRDVSVVRKRAETLPKATSSVGDADSINRSESGQTAEYSLTHSPERAAFLPDDDHRYSESELKGDRASDVDIRDTGGTFLASRSRIFFSITVVQLGFLDKELE